MLNRINAPSYSSIQFDLPEYEQKYLKNGTPAYFVKSDQNELTKLDITFPVGSIHQPIPLLSTMCCRMLEEGTEKYSSEDIADILEINGSYLSLNAGREDSSITIYLLNKHFEKMALLVKEIIESSIFPDKELKIKLNNSKNTLKVNLEKNDFEAQRVFNASVYGKNHNFGHPTELIDYENIVNSDLKKFHKNNYVWNTCKFFVTTGKDFNKTLKLLQQIFDFSDQFNNQFNKSEYNFNTQKSKIHLVEKPDSVQSSIKIGCLVPGRADRDFAALKVAVTTLGGYFGSRLMKNIREDKGYTYGIGASIGLMNKVGVLSISTDVGTNVTKSALAEIYKEIDKIQNELVSNNELNRVKNYIIGGMLSGFDGAWETSDRLKSIVNVDLPFSYYSDFVENISNVSAEMLRNTFNKHIKEDQLFEVVVGNK